MSFLEQLAISLILAVLQEVIKDPAKKAALQTQLLGIAGDLAGVYGYTLTPPAGVPLSASVRPVTSISK